MPETVVELVTTVPDRETALSMGRTAVGRSLAACSQVSGPVTSIYVWKGETHEEGEWVLRLKTLPGLAGSLRDLVRELHPYEVPEILVTESSAEDDYSGWIRTVTRP